MFSHSLRMSSYRDSTKRKYFVTTGEIPEEE